MTREELTAALETITTIRGLTDYLLGLPETELKGLHLGPIKKHSRKYGFDIETGELGDLLKPFFDLEKKRPHFERIGNADIPTLTWVIKGIIEAGSLSMIFGDSGTYKSFIAIAASACVATGKEFYGHSVRKGAVFYIAAEGSIGIIRRFRAWSQENQPITDAPLYRYKGAVNLLEAANTLISALEDTVDAETEPPALAVIDTWSRALTGDDSDTAAAAEGLHKLDIIREKFPGIAIVIIHHTGHREKGRARGASLIHAAVDSEYRVDKNVDGDIIFTNTKSKESELLEPVAFRARRVNILTGDGRLLLNDEGEIETSAVLEITDYIPPAEGIGINQEWILETIRNIDGHEIELKELVNMFKDELGKRKNHCDQALESLEKKELIHRKSGFICLGKVKEVNNA